MKVVLIETLDLEVVKLPFTVSFAFTKKGDKNFWFTPTGICKIYIGHFHNIQMGNLANEAYKMLMDAMKKGKCDLLSNGYEYFTTGNENIIKINNMSSILYKIILEWNTRKDVEGWGELTEGEEFVLRL